MELFLWFSMFYICALLLSASGVAGMERREPTTKVV